MERTLEPELMEEDEQARAYAEADFDEPHSHFIDLFTATFPGRQVGGHVLDLGCGTADITIRFSRAWEACTLHGVDGSRAMLRYGLKILSTAAAVRDRIELIQGLLPGAKLPRAGYDAIISNSLLHHLRDPQVLWASVLQYAVPGAPVFVMDLKRPASADVAAELVEQYAGREPEILKRDFYNSLLAAFEVDEVKGQLKEAGLGGFLVREVSDRHLVVSGKAPQEK